MSDDKGEEEEVSVPPKNYDVIYEQPLVVTFWPLLEIFLNFYLGIFKMIISAQCSPFCGKVDVVLCKIEGKV